MIQDGCEQHLLMLGSRHHFDPQYTSTVTWGGWVPVYPRHEIPVRYLVTGGTEPPFHLRETPRVRVTHALEANGGLLHDL